MVLLIGKDGPGGKRGGQGPGAAEPHRQLPRSRQGHLWQVLWPPGRPWPRPPARSGQHRPLCPPRAAALRGGGSCPRGPGGTGGGSWDVPGQGTPGAPLCRLPALNSWKCRRQHPPRGQWGRGKRRSGTAPPAPQPPGLSPPQPLRAMLKAPRTRLAPHGASGTPPHRAGRPRPASPILPPPAWTGGSSPSAPAVPGPPAQGWGSGTGDPLLAEALVGHSPSALPPLCLLMAPITRTCGSTLCCAALRAGRDTAQLWELAWSVAWHGMEQRGMAWNSMARHGTAWNSTAWHGITWHSMALQGMARQA